MVYRSGPWESSTDTVALYCAHYTLLVLFGWFLERARRAGGRIGQFRRAGGQSGGRSGVQLGAWTIYTTYIEAYIHTYIHNIYIYTYIIVDWAPRFIYFFWYYFIITFVCCCAGCSVLLWNKRERHTESPQAHTHKEMKGTTTHTMMWAQHEYASIYRYYVYIVNIRWILCMWFGLFLVFFFFSILTGLFCKSFKIFGISLLHTLTKFEIDLRFR